MESITERPEADAAELYYHKTSAGPRKSVTYLRFANLSEAVSFVMKKVLPRDRGSCFLEFDERRLGYEDIRKLHQRADPSRKLKSIGDVS